MKKNRILFLLLILVICCSAIFLGCSSDKRLIGGTKEEYEAAGSQKVTLYYNGGVEGSNTEITYFVERGGRLPTPGKSQIVNEPTRAGYQLEGWYEINMDKFHSREELLWDTYTIDGVEYKEKRINVKNEQARQTVYYIEGHDFTNEEYDIKPSPINAKDLEEEAEKIDAGTILAKDGIFANYNQNTKSHDKWSFDFNKIEKDVVLAAIWSPLRYYVLVPPENKNDNFDEVGYNKLKKYSLSATGMVLKPTNSMVPLRKGYQLEGYYEDSGFKKQIEFNSNRYDPGEPEYVLGSTDVFKIVPIYVKYLDAKYKIVNTASDISSITSTGNYYINADLDFTGIEFSVPETYSGEIAGNGKVWRNLSINIKETVDSPIGTKDTYGGIFKTLSGANISKITFENLTIRFERTGTNLEAVDWERDIEINIFARDIDPSKETILRGIKLGSDDDEVKLIVAGGLEKDGKLAFISNDPILDERGSAYLYAEETGGWVSEDENGQIPEDYTYRQNYLGEYFYRTMFKEYNDLILYTYHEVVLPEQAEGHDPRFIETIISSGDENIIDCSIYYVEITDAPIWRAAYGPGLEAPASPGDIEQGSTTYAFVGWFRRVTRTITVGHIEINYTDYEFVDVSVAATESMTLYAMWA